MKIMSLVLFSICFTTSLCSFAQSVPASWMKLNGLIGEWVGQGSGKPGQGGGKFSFQYDLDKKIIVRKSLSEYPAMGNKPAIVHQDLMIIYIGNTGDTLKAIYFDSEGHIINYSVNFSGDKAIQFISDTQQNVPSFRLTYNFSDTDSLTINFEIASPGNSEGFKSYVKGLAHRSK